MIMMRMMSVTSMTTATGVFQRMSAGVCTCNADHWELGMEESKGSSRGEEDKVSSGETTANESTANHTVANKLGINQSETNDQTNVGN